MRAGTSFLVLLLLVLPANRFSFDGKKSIHSRITHEALTFLRPDLRNAIDEANRGEDKDASYGYPERHFGNCLFRESVAYINTHYRSAVLSLVRLRSPGAANEFGRLLHGVQDFYSHSAWVDPAPIGLGLGGEDGPLLETGTGPWSLPPAYTPDDHGVVLIQGNPPPGVTLDLPRQANGRPTSAVPIVSMDGRTYRGLMTATQGPITFATAHCPPAGTDCWSNESVCIRHAEPRKEPEDAAGIEHCYKDNPEIYDNCFHHDDPRRPRYQEALASALRQTEQEWCRLLHMADRADTTGRAVSLLLTVWVKPAGSAHPVGTACGQREPGTTAIGVQLVILSGAADHYAVGLQTTDLRRSARAQFTADRPLAEPLELCVAARDTVLVSVWGWKGEEDFDRESVVRGDLVRIPAELGERDLEGRNGLRIRLGLARASSCLRH